MNSEKIVFLAVIEHWLKKLEEHNEDFYFGKLKNVTIENSKPMSESTLHEIKLLYIKRNLNERE